MAAIDQLKQARDLLDAAVRQAQDALADVNVAIGAFNAEEAVRNSAVPTVDDVKALLDRMVPPKA